MSKSRIIKTETELRQAAREAFQADPLLRWRWKAFGLNRERRPDALVELDLDGRRLGFEVEFKLAPSAREVEQISQRGGARRGLLIAPSLSEVLVAHCRELGLSCADLNGRQWIRGEGVLVDRKSEGRRQYRPTVLPPDPFQPKSSRLVRALLSQPRRWWSQRGLGERTGLSPGLVSRLVRHLVNDGYVEQNKREFRLLRRDALLDAWAVKDDWSRRTTVRQYSVAEADLETVARKLVECFPPAEAPVFTQWFAANLRHAYTVAPVVSAYAERFPGEQALRKLGARLVADGGTLWLAVPDDAGVFRETQRVGEFTLACDAQIYLDLLRAGFRGPEQASALREWKGFGQTGA